MPEQSCRSSVTPSFHHCAAFCTTQPGGRVFANSEELLRYLKDEGVRFVDVRFCDLPGVMQHFNLPVESVDDSMFSEGLAFDGSSIRGFQEIHESDMMLLPDVSSAF